MPAERLNSPRNASTGIVSPRTASAVRVERVIRFCQANDHIIGVDRSRRIAPGSLVPQGTRRGARLQSGINPGPPSSVELGETPGAVAQPLDGCPHPVEHREVEVVQGRLLFEL